MSAGDVIFYAADEACPHRAAFRVNITAATYREGEPVVLDASNELVECAGDPAVITGVAAEPAVSRSNMMAGLEADDTFRTIDRWAPENTFICRYFATAGAGALVTPTHANAVGQVGNLVLNAGGWWAFDVGAGNANAVCIDVLDGNGNSLQTDLVPNTAGAFVVIRPL